MISVFYCRCDDTFVPDGISGYRKRKIEEAALQSVRLQQIAAAKVLKAGFSVYGLEEKDIVYTKNANGKPYVENCPGVYFSLSHTSEIAVASFSGKETGIDCERSDRNISDRVFEKMFTENERRAYENERVRLWTAYESYCKYTGKGIERSNRYFEIPYFESEFEGNGIYFRRFSVYGCDVTLSAREKTEYVLKEIR